MGDEPMVSYLTGSMNTLIGKLTKLKNRPIMVEEMQEDLVLLKEGFFDKLALNGRRAETDAQVRAWMKQVRELVFDIEDWVDEKPEITMADDPSWREEIDFFKTQIQEARERCARHHLLVSQEPTGLDHPDAVLSATQDHFSKLIQDLHHDLESLKKDLVELAGQREQFWQFRPCELQAWELVINVVEWIDHDKTVNDMGRKATQHFKTEIQRARERCKRYLETPYDMLPAAPVPLIDPNSQHLNKETGDIDRRPISKLVEHLADEQETFLKVVSIVGKDGLGKTTLAREAYAKLGCKFECRAFVTIGQRPSLKAILVDIFHQVKPQDTIPEDWTGSPDVQQVITKLRKHLGTVRYFILIDDIRSTYAWKVISCALPDKNHGSRVLTTTCNVEVANTCSMRAIDVVEEMLALEEGESRRLFDKEVKMPVGNEILKMCGGMPLAIIIAAGLLSKSPGLAEPEILQKYILPVSEQYPMSEEMRNILHISYTDLPAPVKSCFLYLSIFPEYYTFKKDRLIRLWVAEGFIAMRDDERRGEEIADEAGRYEESLWGRGESYFNELIGRRLIQPVFGYEDDQAVGCTVHGVILDFIRSMSSKENFVTMGAHLGSGPLPCITDTIRRFSLDCRDNEDEANTLASRTLFLSSMRSLAVFGDAEWTPLPTDFEDSEVLGDDTQVISVLPSFTFLRVLDLEDAGNLSSHHLEGIGGLTLLRYMRLGGTGIHELPEEIGKLEHLETLDVRGANLMTLPATIVGLKRLVSLLIDGAVELPCDILVMQGLEEVSTIGVSSSRLLDSVLGLLRRMQRLRVLGLSLARLGQSGDHSTRVMILSFLMEVARANIVSLSLHCLHAALHGQLPTLYQNHLRRFELTVSGPILGRDTASIPWMGPTHLEIEICDLKQETLRLLGMSSHLVRLKLVSSGNIASMMGRRERTAGWLSGGAFPCLEVLWFTCKDGGMQLLFEPGVMPRLQRLRLDFKAREMLTLCRSYGLGIKYLPGLLLVHATIGCQGATVSDVDDVEAAIRSEAAMEARRMATKAQGFSCHNWVPTVEFSREHEHKMLQAESNRKRIGPLKKMKNLFTSSVPRKNNNS